MYSLLISQFSIFLFLLKIFLFITGTVRAHMFFFFFTNDSHKNNFFLFLTVYCFVFCSQQVLSLVDKRGRDQPPGEGFGTGQLPSWNQGHGQVNRGCSAHIRSAGEATGLGEEHWHGIQKMAELKSFSVRCKNHSQTEVQQPCCAERSFAWLSLV